MGKPNNHAAKSKYLKYYHNNLYYVKTRIGSDKRRVLDYNSIEIYMYSNFYVFNSYLFYFLVSCNMHLEKSQSGKGLPILISTNLYLTKFYEVFLIFERIYLYVLLSKT